MKISHPPTPVRAKSLFKRILTFERCGKYEEGLALVKDFWPDKSLLPDISRFESREAAEMLLRCGAVFGFLGHIKQLPNAQEKSMNLLTTAHERYLDIYDVARIAECEIYLALAYWRTGELKEARSYVETALARDLSATDPVRLYGILAQAVLEIAEGQFEILTALLRENEYEFERSDNDFLLGCFNTNIGIGLKGIGKPGEALQRFNTAREFHERSGHMIYLATVYNNIAQLYKETGDFEPARAASDSATAIFTKLKDKTREGFSLDTKACIFIAEQRYRDAVVTADMAIAILEKSENSAYLIEAYMTRVKALVFMGNISEAAFCLSSAVKLALVQTGEESAKALTRQFEAALNEASLLREAVPVKQVDQDSNGLKLVMPPSIAHYTDIEGVWIAGDHLQAVGLLDGSLAIVVNEPIKRGDLVAIADRESELVSCGFYDNAFGIISLEGLEDKEPTLFNEDEVRILGRIVGVCRSGKDKDGKMIVEAVVAER